MAQDRSQSTKDPVVRNEIPERIVVPPDAGLHGTQALVAMFGIMAVVLLTALDQTIVSTALPRVVADLGGFHLYAWVATANLLTSTVMVPIIGALGDLYGRKPFLLASIIIFTVGSLLAGFSQSMIWLIAARGLQGVGSGMLQATAFTSVSDMFPQPERRARWQGLVTSTFALASLVGPTVGGFLTDGFGWRSVFFISLPFAVLAFSMIWFMLPADLSPRQTSRRIDWAGAFFISTAITTLLLTVEWGGSVYAWGSPQIISLIVATLLLTGIFIWIEMKSPAPLLPIDLFKTRSIAIVCIISSLFGLMMFALSYYNTLTCWIDIEQLLKIFGLQRGDLRNEAKVATAIRNLAARIPTYITLKEVKKRWGYGQEDVFPVTQFEKLWGDLSALPEVNCSYIAVPRLRGQQLKDQAQLDGWLRDGSAAYVETLCEWK